MPRLNKTSTSTILTSLGVAAGALAATPAEATIVVHSVGQSGGEIAGNSVNLDIPLIGGASLAFSAFGSVIAGPAHTTSVFGKGPGAFSFEVQSSNSRFVAQPVAKGTTYIGGGASVAMIDIRSQGGSTFGPDPSGLQYFDFAFSTAGQDHFGWFSGSYHNNSFDNVYFTVQSVAYETTPGKLLGAGNTPIPAPEPPSATLLALGAMVTGAAATRRYKRARRAA